MQKCFTLEIALVQFTALTDWKKNTNGSSSKSMLKQNTFLFYRTHKDSDKTGLI